MTRVKKKKNTVRNSAYLCPHAPLQCDFGTPPGMSWSQFLHPIESGLGHVTSLGQEDISECEASRDWASASTAGTGCQESPDPGSSSLNQPAGWEWIFR